LARSKRRKYSAKVSFLAATLSRAHQGFAPTSNFLTYFSNFCPISTTIREHLSNVRVKVVPSIEMLARLACLNNLSVSRATNVNNSSSSLRSSTSAGASRTSSRNFWIQIPPWRICPESPIRPATLAAKPTASAIFLVK
jgi:hypothetical protein